jgi:CBS domain-containing protein
MKVRDIMTRKVVSVPPDTPVMAVARMLADRGFSAVPVTDSWGMLLGIVSEADLIRRLSTEDQPDNRGLIASLFYDRDTAAERYVRAHGATARDIMSTELFTVTESTTAEHAARMIDEHRVRRLPVVQDGVLVGIVSRADLLRALIAAPTDTSDTAIRTAVQAEMARLPWADAPYVFIDVADGEVTLHGFCHSQSVRKGLAALAGHVPGVKAVHDKITEGPVARWI